jgi:hypothetical protein
VTTVAQLEADIALRLHDVSNNELTGGTGQLLTLINQASRWLKNSGILVPLEEDESLTEAANTYSFAVPANFAYISQIIRQNKATNTYDPTNEIDQNVWRIGVDGGVPTLFFDEVRYLPAAGAKLKIIGQKRPTIYTTTSDTIDEGLENLLLERTLYYAFQFLAAGRSEYAQWRQQEALLARQESELALARAPQQFRMRPNSRWVPGR